MARIIEIAVEKTDENNHGKGLVELIGSGFQPVIKDIQEEFQTKYGYSRTIAKNTYNDLLSFGLVIEHDKNFKMNNGKPFKFKNYVELSSKGRSLIDRLIIPWGLIKAYVVEYGVLATTLVSLGIGIAISTVGKFMWSIIESRL